MMTSIRTLFAASALGLFGCAVLAADPYAGYDSFKTAPLSFDKWLQGERTRVVAKGVLRLAMRDRGDQYSDFGQRRAGYGVDLVDPDAVTQMRATLKVSSVEATGCAANTDPTEAHARIIGSFFAKTAAPAGSQNGDVIAYARLMRSSQSTDPVGVLRVQGLVLTCTNTDCSESTDVKTVELGTADLGQAVDLRLLWDPANNRFRFGRDDRKLVNVSYSGPDALPPNTPFKTLQSRLLMANCFSDTRSTAAVDATFDNLQVNASAAP